MAAFRRRFEAAKGRYQTRLRPDRLANRRPRKGTGAGGRIHTTGKTGARSMHGDRRREDRETHLLPGAAVFGVGESGLLKGVAAVEIGHGEGAAIRGEVEGQHVLDAVVALGDTHAAANVVHGLLDIDKVVVEVFAVIDGAIVQGDEVGGVHGLDAAFENLFGRGHDAGGGGREWPADGRRGRRRLVGQSGRSEWDVCRSGGGGGGGNDGG